MVDGQVDEQEPLHQQEEEPGQGDQDEQVHHPCGGPPSLDAALGTLFTGTGLCWRLDYVFLEAVL